MFDRDTCRPNAILGTFIFPCCMPAHRFSPERQRMILPRGCVAFCSLLLMTLLCTSALNAQESRWKKLNEQTLDLEHKGKYAEALPIAAEALKVAEATFGHNDERVATA